MDMQKLVQQAQEMQKKVQQAQKQLEDKEISGSSGGGLINVTMTGKNDVKKITIDPSLINPDEKDVLEDLIIAALYDAKQKVEELSQKVMGEATEGMPLPSGTKFPF